jgi:alpha-glucosidase (family GH31 glycosyl hydrolase)
MNGLQGNDNKLKHFDVHNLYGYTEAIPTYEAARAINNNNRGFVITRSTFIGNGKYGGHWTGDNHSVIYSFVIYKKNLLLFQLKTSSLALDTFVLLDHWHA